MFLYNAELKRRCLAENFAFIFDYSIHKIKVVLLIIIY